MHAEAFAFVATTAREYRACAPIYEIGSRNINGSVRGLFLDGAPYIGIDLVSGPSVDLVADAATYTPPYPPCTVVCCEVLEHTHEAAAIVAQAAAVLQMGGLLIITAAGEGRAPHSATDGGPIRHGEYYRNLNAGELQRWAEAAGIETLKMVQSEQPADVYYVGRKRA